MSRMGQGETQGVGQLKKCPGVSASTPSSSLGKGTRGWLLRHTSIWVTRVENSLKVSLILVVTRRTCLFRLYTAASHRPVHVQV